jgi:single-strand DNA-binding protein
MYQQITLVGNLGNDPEMRYTPSGVPVTSFSLAVNKSWTSPDGQRQDKVTWFRVSCWRKTAEIASQYLSKGRQVLVIGEIEDARAYTDKNGEMRASLEVRADVVKFLGTREQVAADSSAQSAAMSAATNGSEAEDIPF